LMPAAIDIIVFSWWHCWPLRHWFIFISHYYADCRWYATDYYAITLPFSLRWHYYFIFTLLIIDISPCHLFHYWLLLIFRCHFDAFATFSLIICHIDIFITMIRHYCFSRCFRHYAISSHYFMIRHWLRCADYAIA
jgi:hypothetical protein